MKQMNILMVCLGNICRSPMAQGILEHKIGDNHFVDSAGTGDWHEGQQPDKRSIEVGLKHGIDIQNQRGRQVRISDFEEFDLIFAMDQSNYDNIIALTEKEEHKQKVAMILANKKDVPDPYFGGKEGFEHVYQLLDEATDLIIEKYEL